MRCSGIAGEVELGDWVTMGGGSMVHQFVHIGAHTIIGGGGKVRIDVPPYIKADREPLSYMGTEHRGAGAERVQQGEDARAA
ncbi:MAG: hypothetical protein MZV63_42890 [Marinilabiliales bacterium]|nr:hypothetical protein [Marinilabiliales bacterium]